jgi:DNA invertase Pin-like site-specific DNA recombinase
MTATRVGYARCSTDQQDLAVQQAMLQALGVAPERIYMDRGLTGTTSVYDPTDPMGKMFFNILATFAEFEVDLIRLRTREGMAMARAKGKLRGKRPKLSDKQHKELWRMYETGEYSINDLAELFAVSRPTVYRTLARKTQRSSGR